LATPSGATNDDPRSGGADRTNDVDAVDGGDERDVDDDGEGGAALSSRASPNGAGGASFARNLLHTTHFLDAERGRRKSFETRRPATSKGPGNGAFLCFAPTSPMTARVMLRLCEPRPPL
jgi:hypothetical protein